MKRGMVKNMRDDTPLLVLFFLFGEERQRGQPLGFDLPGLLLCGRVRERKLNLKHLQILYRCHWQEN